MANRFHYPPSLARVALALAFVLGIPCLLSASIKTAHVVLRVTPEQFTLAGTPDGRQLLVTREEAGRLPRDLTRQARYAVTPPGVVTVSQQGYVRAVAGGEAAITVRAGGEVRVVRVAVHDQGPDRPVHFGNEIVPLLTRSGCNAGGCHGKASGQNGFKLSLFGFDPAFDYNALVKEGRGRRVFPAAPARSLLLTKPTAQVPHGGGRRFAPDSEAYRLLYRWIAQGMPLGSSNAPTLQKLHMVPEQRVLDRNACQQVAVLAQYSDGSVRDVTRQAQYQSNEAGVALVDEDGLVRTREVPGEAAIMARYQGQVAAFRATVPLGRPVPADDSFRPVNYIDVLAQAKWKQLGLVPSPVCSDAAFLRRVRLDLCGKLPTPDEVRTFLADRRPDKRARLIDRCLDDKDHAAFFALRWASLLRNAKRGAGELEPATYAFQDWLRDQIARNQPYDRFVRGILTATGQWQDNPPVTWYWEMSDDPLHQPVADTAQLFLGLRLQCARCHHHPYERWSQDDYYGLAGFFARLGRKDFGPEPSFYVERKRTTDEVNPRTGQPLEPKLLDGPVLAVAPGEDPRQKLVDWMTRPENPFFARALGNRLWSYVMGRGLVEPVDDLRETNPPSNPALLDALARDFRAHHFDGKHLLRTICNSRTYQLSSVPNEWNGQDRQNHARYYARRLLAEVLLDAVDQVSGVKTEFPNMPRQARAVDLPHEGFDSYFLDVFERPPRTSACECARGGGANLAQVLHLANSSEVEDKLAADQGRAAQLVQKKVPPAQAVEEIYLAALARYPSASEQQRALGYLGGQKEPRRGLEDLLWALLNSREFQFNH